ncbi:DUF4179 domain-containing protein [Paenibacillus alvei]|uniref:DUF4179 domain-containing protein n=1 Tax=Paenibacillus alvei TaxID=44250 RepID=UPI0013DAA96C|nr:DUF4179 domain-containing protein [Paenibacillus alvei]NEZ41892.1 DUF4179 domain-containing protein [Paenibacillus alvei]
MEHMQRTDYAEMDGIEQMIRDSSLPNSRSDEIMNHIEQAGWSRTQKFSRKPNVWKKTVLVASITLVLGAGIIAMGYVSPAMAEALKKVPMIGQLFADISEESAQLVFDRGIVTQPNLSVTHDGITLKLAEVLYDGTRLSILIERKGDNLPQSTISSYIMDNDTQQLKGNKREKLKKTPEEEKEKGYITLPIILVNGQPFQYGSASFGDYPLEDVAYRIEYTEGLNLPDEFELSMQLNVTGVKETFEFKVPVKVENKSIVFKPNMTKSDGKFSYTVKQLDFSPVSTRLVLDSKGPVPATPEQTGKYHASHVYYEMLDDQGRVIEPRIFGYVHAKPKTEYHVDELYLPVEGIPKSITIKPFTLTIYNKGFIVKGFSKTSQGDRTYLKDLELTIPIQD